MSSESQEIFADDFNKKSENEKKILENEKMALDEREKLESDADKNSEFPPIPNTDPDPEDDIPPNNDDESPPSDKPKGSRKKGILGAVVIGLIIAIAVFSAEQIMNIDLTDNLNPNELDEPIDENSITPEQVQQPKSGSGTEDVSSTSDKVQLEKTKEPTGYFMVYTNSEWYGDYVDFRKLPNKIDDNGTKKISFRCYTDDFQKTSTYFGTFRNVLENNLQVDAFIRDKLVESQITNTNTALILEGSCYQ